MSTCRLYIVDPHSLLTQELIQNMYGMQSNIDAIYKRYVDGYIKTAERLGNKDVVPPASLLSLYMSWAVRDATKSSVERLPNGWLISDSELTMDSISRKAKSLSYRLIRTASIEDSLPVMYITWHPHTKLVVAVFDRGELAFMHVSDNNSILHVDHQRSAEKLCTLLKIPLCSTAYAYCNEYVPEQALHLFSCLLGFSPV